MLIKRIVTNPEILGGKPVIKGTRLSVEFILELLASGMTIEEILEDYSHITREDIYAVLEYAAHALKNDIYVPLLEARNRTGRRREKAFGTVG